MTRTRIVAVAPRRAIPKADLDLDLTPGTPFRQNAGSSERLPLVGLFGAPHGSDLSLRVYAADDWLVSEPVPPA